MSRGEKSKKRNVKIRIQTEKIIEADMADIKKHLLESGRNSECK